MKKLAIIGEGLQDRQRIRNLLTDFCPEMVVVGEADTLKNSLQLILTTCPDAVLLDVALADGSGFDLLDLIPDYCGQIIFLSHHHELAFKAIKYRALDYLLKPIQLKEFIDAVEKLRQSTLDSSSPQLKKLPAVKDKQSLNRITLHTRESLIFVKLKHIVRLEAEGNYTYFYLINNRKVLVSRPLKDYEDILPAASFFRVHQSHLLRIASMKKIIKQDGGYVEMEDGSIIPISRRKKHDFLEYMQ